MTTRWNCFITGTDTGVGKTFVTAALLSALRNSGVDAVAMKPVQTGSARGRSPDLDFCAKVAGWRIPRGELSDLCPYRFPMPASPHLAARSAGSRIVPGKILAAFRRLEKRHESVLVEGAGGLLVPLSASYDQRDLIRALRLPVMVVARAGLGTLNHTLLTVEALRPAGIAIAAVVLSQDAPRRNQISRDNEFFLRERLAPVPVLFFPRVNRRDLSAAGRDLLQQVRAGFA